MSEETLIQTPSQTVGPFFAYDLTPGQYLYDYASLCDGNLILNKNLQGKRITLFGQVLDGQTEPITDALIEIWQADSKGTYTHDPHKFLGFGRYGTGTKPGNYFEFKTIKPGTVGGQAPHINIVLFMRGLLSHAFTRVYFSDETAANSRDRILTLVEPDRRSTLIAQKTTMDDGSTGYKFNIVMQGLGETVFLDV